MRTIWTDSHGELSTEYRGVKIVKLGDVLLINLRDRMNLPTNRDRSFRSLDEARQFIDETRGRI